MKRRADRSSRSRQARQSRKGTSGRRTMAASEFKAHCLRLLDEVARGEEIVITRHGSQIAVISPLGQRTGSSRGSWKGLVEPRGDIVQSDWSEEFDATRSE